jgi:hypothetical protein
MVKFSVAELEPGEPQNISAAGSETFVGVTKIYTGATFCKNPLTTDAKIRKMVSNYT